ncbi:MAG: transporter substrate-binding domain-containing protein [Planctomycetes bacterium]|nr:transporter substrate-binding domain-containing protein [Planctomycetota bacterium]
MYRLRPMPVVLGAHLFLALFLAAAVMCRPLAAVAQTDNAPNQLPILSVATKPTPPFAMKTPDGQWIGLAVALVNDVAGRLNRRVVWHEVATVGDLLNLASTGEVDVAVAAITITADRERRVDFSHSYYESGLAIAVPRDHGASFWSGIQALTSPAFLGTVALLVGLLLAAGTLIWAIERGRNSEQFEGHPVKGIGSGFWWAAVTMTTVGYGDKSPITPLGRVIAVIWMFAALILTAVFTAQLTTALTVHRLAGPVTSFRDLPHSRVGVVRGTASRDYFNARSIGTIPFDSVRSGLNALQAGLIDAFVHDEPILRYDLRRNDYGGIELLPDVFDPQLYGIALPPMSPLREPLNQALLDLLASPSWTAMKAKYFGTSP